MIQHLLQLVAYTMLIAAMTVLALAVYHGAARVHVAKSIRQGTLRHTCEDPENCPAEMVIEEIKAQYHKACIEFGIHLAALLVGMGFVIYALIHISAASR